MKKSPLSVFTSSLSGICSSLGLSFRWYVVPPETSGNKSKGKAKATTETADLNGHAADADGATEGDSTPHNFDTFVPRHDPTLAMAQVAAGSDHTAYALPEPGAMVSQDEAFSRALSAMYWSGYWTAVYHVCAHFMVHSFCC